jgi:hypothetical protein
MEELENEPRNNGNAKDIVYTKTVWSGKRIYYLDVKRSSNNELHIVITESKRVLPNDQCSTAFERHKLFLYKEDFDRFINGISEVVDFIRDTERK